MKDSLNITKLKNKFHPFVNLLQLFVLRGVPFKRRQEFSTQERIKCKLCYNRNKHNSRVVPTQVIPSCAGSFSGSNTTHLGIDKQQNQSLKWRKCYKNKRKRNKNKNKNKQ